MTTLIGFMQAYLVNSLWQLPLLFAVAWLCLRLLPVREPLLRHRIWVATLLLQCALPACQLPGSWRAAVFALFRHRDAGGATVSVLLGEGIMRSGAGAWLSLSNAVLAAYLLVTVALAVRLVWRYAQAAALGAKAQPLALAPADEQWFAQLCQRLHLPLVPIASGNVSSPSTVGIRRRMVLLPAGLQASIATADLHAALAHELVHVKRRDFAKNLLYEAAALAIAYHPALWATRAQLAESREMVCDDTAAALLGSSTGRQVYAHALLRLAAQLAAAPRPHHSHAIGMLYSNSFERRMMQLSTHVQAVRGVRRGLLAGVLGAVSLITCGSALALGSHVEDGAPAPAPQAQSAKAPVKVSSGVMAGQALNKVMPIYPPEAKEAKIQGAVVLHAIISKDGVVESLQVVSGPPELSASAIQAVRQWTYKPFLLNGNPVDVDTTITVNYSLAN